MHQRGVSCRVSRSDERCGYRVSGMNTTRLVTYFFQVSLGSLKPDFLPLFSSERDDSGSEDGEREERKHEKGRMLDLRDEDREINVVEVEDLELDDDMDEDLLASLLDPQMPKGCQKVHFIAGETIPHGCGARFSRKGELVSVLQRVKFDKTPHHCDQRFSSIFNDILRTMAYKFRGDMPYFIMGLHTMVSLPADDEVEVCLTGVAHRGYIEKEDGASVEPDTPGSMPPSPKLSSEDPGAGVPVGEGKMGDDHRRSSLPSKAEDEPAAYDEDIHGQIDITPLSGMPKKVVSKYLGIVQCLIIKESELAARSTSGIGGATHTAILEAHSILRANVAARGGNALLSFKMQECMIKQQKQDMYCVLLMSGDAALMEPTGTSPSKDERDKSSLSRSPKTRKSWSPESGGSARRLQRRNTSPKLGPKYTNDGVIDPTWSPGIGVASVSLSLDPEGGVVEVGRPAGGVNSPGINIPEIAGPPDILEYEEEEELKGISIPPITGMSDCVGPLDPAAGVGGV